MQMKLERKRIQFKSPKDAFTQCPQCRSPRVSELTDEDVYCEDCDWDSIDIHSRLLAEANIWPKPLYGGEYCGEEGPWSHDPVQVIDKLIENEFNRAAI